MISRVSSLQNKPQKELNLLLSNIRRCRECAASLPCEPRPIVAASVDSSILIIGQAPGRRVHESGVPWNDQSGDRLREWMGIDAATFYDKSLIAIVPMGFCYPGTGKSGDMPPRPECAPLWHPRLLEMLDSVRLTLLVGNYSQRQYLAKDNRTVTLTQTVANWKQYRPRNIPLPHPSPRNNRWMSKNPWFADEVLPYLKRRVRQILKNNVG